MQRFTHFTIIGTPFFSIVFLTTFEVQAMVPVLHFTDLTSGPNSGLGDGVGEGAIVTVWGNGLESSQNKSKVFFTDSSGAKREAAHVYYWKNADGTLPGGPADLYMYHKMQEVAFSIPTGSLGQGFITVETEHGISNALPFTTQAGKIYYVAQNGDNTNDGSWSTPWATVDYYDTPAGAAAKTIVAAGDILYVKNVTEDNLNGVRIREKTGTRTAPIGLIAYPGASYTISASNRGGVLNYYPYVSDYWVIAKTSISSEESGIVVGTGWRVVGNEITDSVCADGQGGAITAISGKAGGVKALGNYIHDFGGSCTSSLHHVFYLSNRSGASIEAYELGWNSMIDNAARHALHIYDEHACGDFTGTFKIHGNVVVNQQGAAFNANAGGTNCITAPMDVFNNLFINSGLEPWQTNTINVTTPGLTSHITFSHNTIYGSASDSGGTGTHVYIQDHGSPAWNFGGTFEWHNNIVYDTHNVDYVHQQYFSLPQSSSNNLWYNGGDGYPATPPSFDSDALSVDPLFQNIDDKNFLISEGSPAEGIGASIGGASSFTPVSAHNFNILFKAGPFLRDRRRPPQGQQQ